LVHLARASFHILDKADAERIHEAALTVLSGVGVMVKSEPALSLLARAGASVDTRTRIARIPEGLVHEAISNCPKEFVLGSRDGGSDLQVPAAGRPWICTDGFATEILDTVAGERRSSVNSDLAAFARLVDRLDSVDFFWPIVNPNDHPAGTQMLRAFITSLENTGKHVQHEAIGAHVAKAQIAAASIVAGDEKELARRPLFSAVQCPVAPLAFEEGSIEAAMEFARAGVPVVYMSMPMMGGSAPITLAGSLVQGHAEVLAGLTISQLTAKGARVFHCVLTGPIDMKTGVWASGSPENAIGNAASVQLARHIGMPSMGGGFGTCAKAPGAQAGFEKMGTMVPTALSGVDIVTGVGGLDDAKCMSMVQAVVDSEMWVYVLRMLRGIDIDAESLSVEALREVGPGGLFLGRRDTLSKFRTELWMPTIGQRMNHEQWKACGRPDISANAREKALELSSEPPRSPLDGDLEARLEELLGRAAGNA